MDNPDPGGGGEKSSSPSRQNSRRRRSNRAERRKKEKVDNSKKLPDRWLKYDAVGRDIPGTRILAFKTPLDATFFQNRAADDRFEVGDLLNYASSAGKTLGLVVDLTNTERYYNWHLWRENGVEYVKIRCPGHEINRQPKLVDQFIRLLRNFFRRNFNNEKIVGVHCTHGLNRTGYLICRYLMDCLQWSATRAINVGNALLSEFEMYRGYKIERDTYIASLHQWEAKRSSGCLLLPPPPPPPPVVMINGDDDELVALVEDDSDAVILLNSNAETAETNVLDSSLNSLAADVQCL